MSSLRLRKIFSKGFQGFWVQFEGSDLKHVMSGCCHSEDEDTFASDGFTSLNTENQYIWLWFPPAHTSLSALLLPLFFSSSSSCTAWNEFACSCRAVSERGGEGNSSPCPPVTAAVCRTPAVRAPHRQHVYLHPLRTSGKD